MNALSSIVGISLFNLALTRKSDLNQHHMWLTFQSVCRQRLLHRR